MSFPPSRTQRTTSDVLHSVRHCCHPLGLIRRTIVLFPVFHRLHPACCACIQGLTRPRCLSSAPAWPSRVCAYLVSPLQFRYPLALVASSGIGVRSGLRVQLRTPSCLRRSPRSRIEAGAVSDRKLNRMRFRGSTERRLRFQVAPPASTPHGTNSSSTRTPCRVHWDARRRRRAACRPRNGKRSAVRPCPARHRRSANSSPAVRPALHVCL